MDHFNMAANCQDGCHCNVIPFCIKIAPNDSKDNFRWYVMCFSMSKMSLMIQMLFECSNLFLIWPPISKMAAITIIYGFALRWQRAVKQGIRGNRWYIRTDKRWNWWNTKCHWSVHFNMAVNFEDGRHGLNYYTIICFQNANRQPKKMIL